jgi:hypothetical protein
VDIHEDDVEILFANRFDGLLAILDNNNPMSAMRQYRRNQTLIDQIIFGHKDIKTGFVPVYRRCI